MQPRPILVPVDLGPESMDVVQAAREIAAKLGSPIRLLYVYTLVRFGYPGMAPALLPDLNQGITAAAERAANSFAVQARLDICVRQGEPAEEILAEVERTKPSLVVMGTHGRRGVARWLLGSVAERVLRKSPVPVMTVRPTATTVAAA
jgi:nucleotide-binding universal stress UspA family protein